MSGMDNISFFFCCMLLSKICVTNGTTVAPLQTEGFRIPYCERNGIFLRVNESEPVNQVVYKLNCTDEDGDKLKYVIENGNTYNKFLINQTGHIKLAKTLNADFVHKYHLRISVTEETEKRFSTSVTLAISIININDNTPVIKNLPFELSIRENTSIGTIIATCFVTDKDDKKNALVGQTIVHLFKTDVATIDSTTCDIYLNTELNYEEKKVYNVEVIASDRDPVAPRTVSQMMKINVLDVNDNSPECKEYYLVKIMEDLAINTSIESIPCSDADSGNNSVLFYKISDNNDENVKTTFQMNTCGELYLQQQVDYESQRLYEVRIDVYDGGSPSLTTSVLVSVVVSDVDDNIPTWSTSMRQENVDETLPVGTIVFVMTATDKDGSSSTTSKITYKTESISRDWFDIIPNTGVVKITSPLDWTVEHYVIMNISAHSSNRVSAKSFIIVNITITDFNNVAPVFSKKIYKIFVKEGTPVGISITKVKAFDPESGNNGRFSYGIDGQNVTVEPNSGVISLLQPLKYSPEADAIIVQLVARDFGVPSLTGYAMLQLRVLPSNSTIKVSHDGPVDAHLDELCMDGNVTLGICVDDNTACDVQSLGQKGYCRCSRGFVKTEEGRVTNCEEPPKRIFNEAMRKIYIEPERQIDISFNIEKKYKPKNFQLTMFPSHGDIKTTFQNSIIEFDVRNAVLHRSQRIMIRMTTQIDKIFIADSMLLELNVITQKNTTTENESIMENATDGTIVCKLEGDYTNYELEGCSSNFVVQNDKQIVTKGELDRETIDEYVCIVKAYPNDNISCVLEEIAKLFINVTDVNDNPPTFDITLYSGCICENKPINTTVEMQIPISSTDRDISSNNVTYEIVDGDTEFFYLEKLDNTREVNIKSKKILDRETHNFHHLSIDAFDGVNRSPVVNVTIVVVDVDEPPKFKHDHYSFNVSEKNDGGLVGTVLAEDNDEEGHDLILYTIKSGAFGKFRVDSKNGSIFLQGDVPSKNNTSYDFIIFATYENVTTNVSVFVLDVNESPVFEKSFVFYVNEQNNGSIYIGTIKAFDPDFGNNASLIYQVIESNPKRSFFFPNQPNNGRLFIQDGLDYEKIKMLNFVVKAVDGGNKSATTTVVVHVRDVNDNKPIPTKEEFSTVISSRSLNFFEKPLLIIEASDADSGDNGRLFYSIVDNEDGVFGITHDGVVIVNKTVNSLQKQTYRFRVNISDRGNPPQSTLVNVSIRVDSTTKEPWFKDPKIILSLKEQSYNNTILIENMTSYLETWNGKSVSFKLDDFIEGITLSENGVLKLNKTIDRETQENYKLIVSVKDNNNITSDITLIQLNVNDTNDNYPKVNVENIEFVTILENEEYGTNVILVNATDADEDTVFEYSIVNETVPFVIDKEGYVTVSGELDRENISEYNLGIKVSDGENYIVVPVTVYVLDVNDNPPNISSTSFDISESHQTKTIVTNIYFLDADTRVSELTLTVDKDCPINIIPDNSNKNTLASKNTSAEVFLTQPLDYERKKKYLCEIVVSDGTENNITIQSSTYTLTITVMDENDNAPEIINFKEKEINLTVFDPVGKIIVQSISATDEDSGKNGEILFGLLDANKDPFDKFVINETTGQIAIASELLNVDFGTYKMVIVASDQGVQPQSSTAVCMIKIPQSKDIPIILSEKTEYEVDENKVNVTLDTLQIQDFINNERIPCELCKFHLDDDYVDISENGVLSLKRGFDREKFSVYKFLVRAEDNDVPTNTGAKQFTIHIKDVNEYEPKCGMNSFDNTKEENILGYINVTDDDATSVFKYEKHNSSRVCDNSLLVNYTSGLININQTPKKFENCTMETKISDERYTLDCTISITIYPGNVYAPQFTKGLYETTLPVDAKKGYRLVIYNFKANDSDGDQVMYYFPRKQEIDGYFQINPKTGILMLYSDLKVDETTTVITKALIAVDGANKPKTATTIVKISLTGRVCLNEDAYNTQTKTSTLYTILFYVILSCLCVFIVLFVLSCYKWQSFKRRETVLKSKYYYSYPLPTRYREPVKISDGIFDRAYNTGQEISSFPVHWNSAYDG